LGRWLVLVCPLLGRLPFPGRFLYLVVGLPAAGRLSLVAVRRVRRYRGFRWDPWEECGCGR